MLDLRRSGGPSLCLCQWTAYSWRARRGVWRRRSHPESPPRMPSMGIKKTGCVPEARNQASGARVGPRDAGASRQPKRARSRGRISSSYRAIAASWSSPGKWKTRWSNPYSTYVAICSTCSSGVGRHQPASVGDVLDGLRQPLHLARVLDADLLLAGECQGGPDLGVLHRPRAIGVEADLHLDHPAETAGIAPGLRGTLLDGGQERLGVQLRPLARGADEPVADPPGKPRRGRPRGRDVDRDRLVRPVVDRGVVGPVVLALER